MKYLKGLQNLKELGGLLELNLNETQVTDACLKDLKELKSLRKLNLYETKITAAGLKDLKVALPTTDIFP
jgi:hypothetical protein